jgi:hypothetical protein
MTVPQRNYVGCSCEIVYAHLERKPIVVYVGTTDNASRIWLQYHASGIFEQRADAIEYLLHLLHERLERRC